MCKCKQLQLTLPAKSPSKKVKWWHVLTCLTCSGFDMPKPTATGLLVTCKQFRTHVKWLKIIIIWTDHWMNTRSKTCLWLSIFSSSWKLHTFLTSWMRDSTCGFTFSRGPVTPLTLTCIICTVKWGGSGAKKIKQNGRSCKYFIFNLNKQQNIFIMFLL
jgi:hypothetical protein